MAGRRALPDLPLTSRQSPRGLRGALQASFFRLRRPPRALQERSKRLSAAITQLSDNPMKFYIDVDSQKVTLGPQKSMNYIGTTMLFEEITFSARVASWTRFWTLLASLSEAFWPSRWLKPVLEFLLERPRAVQDYIFGTQERPKRRPRAPQEATERPPGCQDNSKSSPRRPRIDFRLFLASF